MVHKQFKQTAEAHGLICTKSDRYGWSNTSAEISDTLIEWLLKNNIQEIRLNRNEGSGIRIAGGSKTANGAEDADAPEKPKAKGSRKYVCPCCGTIIRATREVNVICGDCGIKFEQAE